MIRAAGEHLLHGAGVRPPPLVRLLSEDPLSVSASVSYRVVLVLEPLLVPHSFSGLLLPSASLRCLHDCRHLEWHDSPCCPNYKILTLPRSLELYVVQCWFSALWLLPYERHLRAASLHTAKCIRGVLYSRVASECPIVPIPHVVGSFYSNPGGL